MEYVWIILAAGLLLAALRLAWAAYARRWAGEVNPVHAYRKGAFREKLLSLGSEASDQDILQDQLPASWNSEETSRTGSMATGNQSSANAQTEKPSQRALWGAAAADVAMVPGVDLWMRWSTVDSHVFQAVEHLSHEQIDGVADLLGVVDAKGYAFESAGFFNKLLGHVGEWHAYEHMAQAGIAAAMPIGSNQAGFDILINEQGINIKTVQDAASAASAHFAKYPDIPIILPGDAANIPADALYFDPSHATHIEGIGVVSKQVIVDTALSHAEVAHQTQNAIDVIADPGVDAHFPWITMAVSGFRELKLLNKGNTDLARAAKNVGVDVAAVGAGGAAGAKLGAVIGTFVGGPVGTVIGGLIGTAVGGAGGRVAANTIKLAPLRKAQESYELSLATCKQKQGELAQYAAAKWNQEKRREGERLQEVGRGLKHSVNAELGRLRAGLKKKVIFSRGEAESYLQHASRDIDAVLASDEKRLKDASPAWVGRFGSYFAPRERAIYLQHKAEVAWWKGEARKVLSAWQENAEGVEACLDLLLATPSGSSDVDAYLESIDLARAEAVKGAAEAHKGALNKLVSQRAASVSKLRDTWQALVSEVEQKFSPFMESLKSTSEAFRSELRRAGLESC